jgi:hypothetical protein
MTKPVKEVKIQRLNCIAACFECLLSHEVSLYPGAVCDQDLEQDVDQEKKFSKAPKEVKSKL